MINYDKLLITKIKNSSISMYLCGYFIQKLQQTTSVINKNTQVLLFLRETIGGTIHFLCKINKIID